MGFSAVPPTPFTVHANTASYAYWNAATTTSGTGGLGSWVELVASIPNDVFITSIVYVIAPGSTATPNFVNVQLGIGAGGSESTIISVLGDASDPNGGNSRGGIIPLSPQAQITTSTRLAARTQVITYSATFTINVGVNYVPVSAVG